MSDLRPYTYATLRYVHDPMTGEFVNVGIVLCCPKARFIGARMRKTHGRLSSVFPDLDRQGFRSAMRRLEREFARAASKASVDSLLSFSEDAASIARKVLPSDASSLQWSPIGTGLARDHLETLDRLYGRLVGQYDTKSDRRRTDDDVWRPVREQLEQREIADRFSEKKISGPDDTIEFRHAWKNGVWHCVQPLSFDLADDDGIKDKARRWTGHLAAVSDASEKFKPYFLVAEPSNPRLKAAFKKALLILQKSPIEPEIYLEGDVSTLVSKMEDEIRQHEKQAL